MVDPRSAVHPSARLGTGCRIGPFCVVEEDAELGADGVMEPFARICHGVVVGNGAILGQGAVAGGLAQVHDPAKDGGCRIGDGCRLGEYATVNRSATSGGETRLGRAVMVLAYSHVAHDCRVGDGAVLANGVQLGGHVEVGSHSFLGGGAHVHQHVRIGEMSFAAGRIRLDRDLAPWSRALGEPPRWAGLNRIAFSRAPEQGDPLRHCQVAREGIAINSENLAALSQERRNKIGRCNLCVAIHRSQNCSIMDCFLIYQYCSIKSMLSSILTLRKC